MVSSYLQLLRRRYRGKLDEDADAFIDYAVDGAARMRTLIEDLLAYSRAGRSERPTEPVNTARVVAEVAATLRALADDEPPEIEWGELPTVDGDPAQLVQLFQNLIGNGVKFVAPGVRPHVRRRRGARRRALALHGRGQRHRDRAAPRRAGVRHVPAAAHARRVRGHGHRPGDRAQGRRAPRRRDLGRAARAAAAPASRSRCRPGGRPREPARVEPSRARAAGRGQRGRRPAHARGAARGRRGRAAVGRRRRRAGARLPAPRGGLRRGAAARPRAARPQPAAQERARGARGDARRRAPRRDPGDRAHLLGRPRTTSRPATPAARTRSSSSRSSSTPSWT